MDKKDLKDLTKAKNILCGFVARAKAQKIGFNVPDEKLLTEEEKKEIRFVCALLNALLVREKYKMVDIIYKDMREHPEHYSTEFLKQSGFDREEVKRLTSLANVRKKEIKQTEIVCPLRFP